MLQRGHLYKNPSKPNSAQWRIFWMPSNLPPLPLIGKAEAAFRTAFERLKSGQPKLLPKGSLISQNNVAREAGLDPSALKKTRFPSLVAEIQLWINEFASKPQPSKRQTLISQRKRNRNLRERMEAMKAQRDIALSLLVAADARILELTAENNRLKGSRQPSNLTSIQNRKPKRRT
ncbi:hypothetical protein PchlO6_6054 [Pseudomonas chlororaphis O6]|uniref:Transposase n=1 Tax=Pseudomonas chlororaphis O6 TaxID=1037915 RepID=A0AB33WVL7_9PSED|nr:hypothetical protein PchlO6_6054 [Pseudomonas chlororaphis O6]